MDKNGKFVARKIYIQTNGYNVAKVKED